MLLSEYPSIYGCCYLIVTELFELVAYWRLSISQNVIFLHCVVSQIRISLKNHSCVLCFTSLVVIISLLPDESTSSHQKINVFTGIGFLIYLRSTDTSNTMLCLCQTCFGHRQSPNTCWTDFNRVSSNFNKWKVSDTPSTRRHSEVILVHYYKPCMRHATKHFKEIF